MNGLEGSCLISLVLQGGRQVVEIGEIREIGGIFILFYWTKALNRKIVFGVLCKDCLLNLFITSFFYLCLNSDIYIL